MATSFSSLVIWDKLLEKICNSNNSSSKNSVFSFNKDRKNSVLAVKESSAFTKKGKQKEKKKEQKTEITKERLANAFKLLGIRVGQLSAQPL
jgi:hypothetical protein